MIIPIVLVLGIAVAGFYVWARRQGLTGGEAGPEQGREKPRAARSAVTEAVAYVGAALVLAGGIAALSQRWQDLTVAAQVAVLAGGAVFFLLVGLAVLRIAEPAVQRLAGLSWFLSVPSLAAAVAFAMQDGPAETTVLVVGAAVTGYAALLWWWRRRPLQVLALFAGLVTLVVGAVATVGGQPLSLLAVSLLLWAFGLVWAGLAWERYLEPLWVSVPLGVVLVLASPALAVADHAWLYALGLAGAAAAMAGSVPLRNTPLLGLGTVAFFGYVTSIVVRYFSESLGVPAALSMTGVVVLLLAVVSARLMRLTRSETPAQPRPETPARRRGGPAHRGLPRAT